MKKRTLIAVMTVLMCVLLMAGCADRSDDPDQADKTAEVTETVQEQDGPGQEEPEKEEPEDSEPDKEEKTGETENEGEGAGADADSFAEAFEKGMVENGSYFVRLANKVYFRKISPESMDAGAQFGGFLHTEFTPTKCPLICYDLDTGKYEEVGDITGVGRLYACPEGFYIGEMNPNSLDSYCTDLYDPATGESDFYCKGTPLGVSESGKLLAVEQYGGQNILTAIIKDGKETASLGGENIYYQYCGFAGETLIALLQTADEEYIVCSVEEDGEITQLGSTGGYDEGYPQIEELKYVNGNIYLILGYYEGTGHFLSHWTTYKAIPGKSGSVEEVTEGREEADGPDEEGPENEVPKICFDTGDAIFYSPHRPYEAYMGTGDNSNNMYYYDDIYEECLLLKDFIKNDYGEECQIIQDIKSYPEAVFVIYADAKQDEEYSIGWRTGYRMTGLHICAVPLDFGSYDEESAASGIVRFD